MDRRVCARDPHKLKHVLTQTKSVAHALACVFEADMARALSVPRPRSWDACPQVRTPTRPPPTPPVNKF